MKKIYLFLVVSLVFLSACSLVKNNSEDRSGALVGTKDALEQSTPDSYQEDALTSLESPVAKANISLVVINSETPDERHVVIKNNGEEIFRFPSDRPEFDAAFILQSGNDVYFYVTLTGFGGCIYSEYYVKTLYKFNLLSRELTTIADKVAYISFASDFNSVGYVQDGFYVLKNLQTGQEDRRPFPANASMYRDWILSPDGQQVSMIGYVGQDDSGCFWDNNSPTAEETYIWNLANNELTTVASGPMGLEKPQWK